MIFVSLALFHASAGFADSRSKTDPDQIGIRDIAAGINFYSVQRVIDLGNELSKELECQVRLENDVIPEYGNRIGQTLVRNSDAKVPFTIKVIRSDAVNALASPGGFLQVTIGLTLLAASEAELAGALAHEIAHLAARHATREATRKELLHYCTIPLVFIGDWPGLAIRQATGTAMPLAFLKFTRGTEAEADMFGIQYLYKAGCDPAAFVDFLERLSKIDKKPGAFARMRLDHPSTKSCIRAIQRQTQRDLRPRQQYVMQTSEFESIQARLIALGRGRQGWHLFGLVYAAAGTRFFERRC
jgi:predicted Zn-dependent protease